MGDTVTEKPKEGSVVRDKRGNYWRVNRTRCINLMPEEERLSVYAWVSWPVLLDTYGPVTLIRNGKAEWVDHFPRRLHVW